MKTRKITSWQRRANWRLTASQRYQAWTVESEKRFAHPDYVGGMYHAMYMNSEASRLCLFRAFDRADRRKKRKRSSRR